MRRYGVMDDDIEFIFGDLDPTEALAEDKHWTEEYWEGCDFDPETGIYYDE